MLQNLQIRSKLVAILILPLLALAVLASSLAVSRISASASADRLARITQFGASSLTDLVDALQRERAVTNGYVASGHKRNFGTMIADRVLVNEAAHALDTSVRQVDLADYPPALRADLASARTQLARLLAPSGQRSRLERPDASVADVSRIYDPLIDRLIATIAGIGATDTGSSPLTRNLAAFAALARAKEAASQSQSLVLAVLTKRSFSPDEYRQFAALDGRQSAWLEQFRAAADPRQQALFTRTVAGRDIDRIAAIEQRLLTARSVPSDLTPQAWFFPTSARADLLHQFELGVKDDVLAAAAASRTSARQQATGVTVTMALILALGIGLSLLLARSMARPLLVLERTARAVADEQLPGVVGRLQDAGEDADLVAITREGTAPVPIRSRDEIGRLAEAFNAVHQVAVRVAVEQAALRRSIGDMILNLARRSQSLIDRQLELIDELEREADDDDLEQMFKLDHLATRMRRNAENLIVLSGGADAARRLAQPVPLVDVVRAAMSEVEDYQRVEILPIDDASVTGRAVADVVHLLAELIENATSFSPPGTKVQIATQQAANGYVLEIEDRGLGMSDEELLNANHRLANPPAIDFAVSRVLGLYVVGRLARRHAIKVQLRHSWYGGVTALVLLPARLISLPVGAGPLPEARPLDKPELLAPARSRWPAGDGGSWAGAGPSPADQLGPGDRVWDDPTDDPTGVIGTPLRAVESIEARAEAAGRVEVGVEHLPIFERARSDWFDTSAAAYVPLRRHAPQQAPLSPRPVPPRPLHAVPDSDAPKAPPGSPRPDERAPDARSPSHAPEVLPIRGPAGLPRRNPRASMAEGLASPAPPPQRPVRERPGRTPEEIRAMLSSYSSGLERGRRMAGGGDGANHNGIVANDGPDGGDPGNGFHTRNGDADAERVWPYDDPDGTEEPR
jgi:HAMP domain-containing protein